jgi:hypothetical protein
VTALLLLVADLKLGTLADWVTALGTVGAFWATYGLLRKELEDRRRAQARLVNAWHEYKAYSKRPGRVVVKNGSEEPVYDVIASTITAGTPWASDPEWIWPAAEGGTPG